VFETLVVILGTGLVGGALFLVLRAQARQRAAVRALCESRGWAYARNPERTVLWRATGHTSSGEAWTLELHRTRGSNSTTSTRWITHAGAIDGAVLLGPATKGMGAVPLSNPLMQLALRAILGDLAIALKDAREVQVGSADFRASYGVLATSAGLAAEVLSGPAELALVEWAASRPRHLHPRVMCWREGLTVHVHHGIRKPEDLADLVDLGELILAAR